VLREELIEIPLPPPLMAPQPAGGKSVRVLTVYSSQRGGRLADSNGRFAPVWVRPLGSCGVSDWLLRQTGAIRDLRHFGLHLQEKA